MGRILGLDWGKKRVGIAISDLSASLASPFTTLDAKPRQRLLEQIREILANEEVECVVVGLPLNMNGSQGASAKAALELADEVKQLGVRVETHDERLSSFEATRLLQGMGRKPSKNKAMVDKAAAAVFLQDYLDSRRT